MINVAAGAWMTAMSTGGEFGDCTTLTCMPCVPINNKLDCKLFPFCVTPTLLLLPPMMPTADWSPMPFCIWVTRLKLPISRVVAALTSGECGVATWCVGVKLGSAIDELGIKIAAEFDGR